MGSSAGEATKLAVGWGASGCSTLCVVVRFHTWLVRLSEQDGPTKGVCFAGPLVSAMWAVGFQMTNFA